MSDNKDIVQFPNNNVFDNTKDESNGEEKITMDKIGEGAFKINITNPALNIKVYYHDDKYPGEKLTRIEKFERGDFIDLRAAATYEYKVGDFFLIPLGVTIQLPEGYYAELVPRSSTFKKYGLIQTNSIGIIDESYCGIEDEWKMPVLAIRGGRVNKNDRICQFRICRKIECTRPIEISEMKKDEVSTESRGGFGSTDEQ